MRRAIKGSWLVSFGLLEAMKAKKDFLLQFAQVYKPGLQPRALSIAIDFTPEFFYGHGLKPMVVGLCELAG